jgi:hypothetical protein
VEVPIDGALTDLQLALCPHSLLDLRDIERMVCSHDLITDHFASSRV